jgi:hypothetical protein
VAGRGLAGGEGQQLLGNTPLASPDFTKHTERQKRASFDRPSVRNDKAARRDGSAREC